jgi:SAM-dependent methyltransferase
VEQTSIPTEHDATRWWTEHYDGAAVQIVEFLAGDGYSIEGKEVADIGSGDGIIDLGVWNHGRPSRLVGYDVRPTDMDALIRSAAAAGIEDGLPDGHAFTFVKSEPDHLPSLDERFDVVYTWSVFEHVSQPVVMLREVRRIIKPDGLFFLQIWPLFGSRHGGHAWMAIDEPFAHLSRSPFELERDLIGRQGTDPTRSADDEFRSLNRLTLDQLQRALLLARLRIAKIELTAETIHIPPELAHQPLVDMAVSGVKLLAAPF